MAINEALAKYLKHYHKGEANAVTAEARTALVDAVNDAYEQRLQERMEQSEDVPAQGMEQQM